MVYRIGALVLGSAMVFACAAAPADPSVARCPPTAPTAAQVPSGARLLARAPRPGAPLVRATLTAESPQAARPEVGLAELEYDDIQDRKDGQRLSTSFDTSQGPHSLVCYYGTSSKDAVGRAASLLVPLPPATKGDCIVTHRRSAGAAMPTTAVCMRQGATVRR